MAENDTRYMHNSEDRGPRASLESPVQAPRNTERQSPAQRPPPRNSERPPRTAEQPPPRTAERPPITSERPPKTAERPPKTAEQPPRTAEKPPRTAEHPPRTAEQPPRTAEQPPRTAEKPKQAARPPKEATQPKAPQQKVQPPTEPNRPTKQTEQSRNRDSPERRPIQQQQSRTATKPSTKAVPRKRMNNTDDSFIARMRKMSTIWKIASILFLVGFVFAVIAYATPHWLDYMDNNGDAVGIGLWSNCTTLSSCNFRGLNSNCLNTLRGFGGVAVLQCVMVCPLLVGYINRPSSRRCTAITVIIVCSLIAVCIQIVTTSFTRSSGCSDPAVVSAGRWGWSLALSVVAILCLTAAAVLFFVQELRVCAAYRKGQHPRRTLGGGIRVT